MVEDGPRRSRRIAAGVLMTVGIVAALLAVLLLFSHVTSYGVDCGTVLSPKNDPPPNSNPLAGCGGDTAARAALVVVSGLVAAGCIIGGILLRRRSRGPSADGTAPD